MECGGKPGATPLWITSLDLKRRRRCALPAHSKWRKVMSAAIKVRTGSGSDRVEFTKEAA
jgi:hypothetical protein